MMILMMRLNNFSLPLAYLYRYGVPTLLAVRQTLLFILLLVPLIVFAEIKMGVVNVGKIMEKAPQADQAIKNLEREFAPRDKELRRTTERLLALEDELKKNAAIMSEAERKRKERQLITGRRELKRSKDEWREDLALRRNEELGKLQRKILQAIDSLAKAEKFDVVLGEGVIFARDTVDITDKVLRKLNSLSKEKKVNN